MGVYRGVNGLVQQRHGIKRSVSAFAFAWHLSLARVMKVSLEAIEREMARYEWRYKLSQRTAADLGESEASLLEQERQQRARSRVIDASATVEYLRGRCKDVRGAASRLG